MNEDALKDMRLLTIQTMEKIIEGCMNIREDDHIHKDAKELAGFVIKDCKGLLLFIRDDKDEQ